MSAIFGIINHGGGPYSDALAGMNDALAHRGPDGQGLFTTGAVGLGHRMLWTTPESVRERLPLESPYGGSVVTADARIDNRDELIPALGLSLRPAEGIADSELILAAYEKWGDECPQHLLGDFAFAIWDKQRRRLFCARDHFGVRPFYYYASGEHFAFATEIKALFHVPGTPRELNEDRVAAHLAYMVERQTDTFYKGIHRLPPAHTLLVQDGDVRTETYWRLDPKRDAPPASDEEYAAQFRRLFTEAVRCRMRSAFPLGALLSGGLDSSSIACVARDIRQAHGGGVIPTFSAVFEDRTDCDERCFINEVLNGPGFAPVFVSADQINPLGDPERDFRYKDSPFFGPNQAMMWELHGAARARQIRVILDGNDGDSTVSHGAGYLRELARSGRWLRLYREARGAGAVYNEGTWNVIRSYIRDSPPRVLSVPLRAFRRVRRVLKRGTAPAPAPSGWRHLVRASFAHDHDLIGRKQRWLERGTSASTEREEHWATLTAAIQALALEEMDTISGSHGIETRYPFWDKRLVEFCLSLPPDQKLSRGWTRAILRRAMGGVLPDAVRWRRTKIDFLASFCDRLIRLNGGVLDELDHAPLLQRYVSGEAFRDAHRRVAEAPLENRPDVFAYWFAVSLACWIQRAWPELTGDPSQATFRKEVIQ